MSVSFSNHVEPPLVDRRSRGRRDADPRLALPLLPPPGAGDVGRMVGGRGIPSEFEFEKEI